MANTSSAKKSIRVLERKRIVNRNRQGRIRTYVKRIESAIESKNTKEAKEVFKEAQPIIQAGVNKGVMTKSKVSRTIKRLNTRIMEMK